jgi:hypothetical protein
MRLAAGALVILAVALGVPAAAIGSRVEAGAGAPSTDFAGNDGAGPITFQLWNQEGTGKHPHNTLTVRQLRFANSCALGGTKVSAKLGVDSSGHFDQVGHGITLQGTLTDSDSAVTGTVRIDRGCDSGVLTFSATFTDD